MAERTEVTSVGPEFNETWVGRIKRTSWGAIFAGAFAALLAWIILMSLGLSIGLGTIHPVQGGTVGVTFLSVLWFIVASIISFFFGGWVAGILAGVLRRVHGGLHGLVSMSLATVFLLFAMTSAVGGLLGSAFSLVGNLASANQPMIMGQISGQKAPGHQDALNNVKQQANDLIQRQGNAGAGVQAQLDRALDNMFAQGANPSPSSRDDVVNILTRNTNMSRTDAENTVDNWVSSYQSMAQAQPSTGQQVNRAVQNVAGAASAAMFGFFLAILLSGIAAYLGGVVGTSAEEYYLPTGRVEYRRPRVREEIRRRPVEEVQP